MHTWGQALKGYLKPAVFIFFFLGLSCGLPYSLIGYSLSLWLADTGISLSVIGFFALVLLPYNFKFLWAPFIDKVKIPFISEKIGAKKAWLILFQMGLILSVLALSYYAPDKNNWLHELQTNKGIVIIPLQTYLFSFLVGFFAASQDIVVDSLRIDTLEKEEMGEGAGMYQFGYRMGMLTAGAGVVALSALIGWQMAYAGIGFILCGSVFASLFVKEAKHEIQKGENNHFFYDMVIAPFKDFMKHNKWALLLIFIVLYKLCNAVLGRMALPFYKDLGFSKAEIALISGTIGPWITLMGVAIGGVFVMRYKILKLLMALGIVEILTSIVFALFSYFEHSTIMFLIVILFDNIVGGMGGAVFIAFLSGLCSKKYSATQYALLTSLMMLAVSVISVYSGIWAEEMGWFFFFLFTGVLMLPALGLLSYLIIHEKK